MLSKEVQDSQLNSRDLELCHQPHKSAPIAAWLLTILYQNGVPLLPKQGHVLQWQSLVLFCCSMNSFISAVTLLMPHTKVAPAVGASSEMERSEQARGVQAKR